MELREIKYIIAIAEYGSISKAAEKLYMAQSSLSQFLKNYEKNFGYNLFVRSNQGLKLTYEGKVYLKTASQIMNLKRNLINQLSDTSALKKGKVIFSISPYRAPYLLPLVLPDFSKKYLGIDVEIVETDMINQEALLKKEAVDIGFLCLPLNSDLIKYETIMEEEILLAAHSKYNLAKKAHHPGKTGRPWIDINDVIDVPFLLFNITSIRLRELVELLLKEYNITPNVIQSKNNFGTILSLANAGMGMTFVPETYMYTNNQLQYFSIGENGKFRSIALAFPPSGYISKATRAFANSITTALKAQRELLTENSNREYD